MKKVKRYRNLEFWAEGGYVYMIHIDRAERGEEKTDELGVSRVFKGLPPEDFMKRAIAAASFAYRFWNEYPSELKRVKQFLEDVREVYKTAKEQAPPEKRIQIFIPSKPTLIANTSGQVQFHPVKTDPNRDIIENVMLEGYEIR